MSTSLNGFMNQLKESNDTLLTPQHNRKLFEKLTWSRDQLFKTVSHNTVDETFKSPSNTFGGPYIGVPCVLPVVYPDCTECLI